MNILQPDATLGFSPVWQCVAFFVLFGLCGANSFIVSGFARHIIGTIDRIFVFVIAFLTQVIMITTVLGVVGRLNFFNIVVILLVFFIFLLYLRFRLALRKRSLVRSLGIRPPSLNSPFLNSPVLILLGLLVLVLVSFLFVWAVVSPPPASDAFIYHLTLPARWMQTGTIAPDQYGPFGESFHPSNPEALLLWAILPFHEDTFANLISWVFWFLCAFAVFSISISLMASHSGSVAAAMIWLALPLGSRTVASAEVDLFTAFFFLVSVLFLVRYRAERHVVFLLWGGISLGIFLGSKLIALPFSLPLFALYAMLIFERKQKRANNLAVFLMSAMLLSLFWYAGNFVLTGNPFHPIEITVLGHVIVPGDVHRGVILASAAHTSQLFDLLYVIDEIFGIYLALVLLISLVTAIVHKMWSRRLITTAVLLLPVVLTVLFWLVGINRINSARYLFPAAALACVAWSIVVPRDRFFRVVFYLMTLGCVAKSIVDNRFLLYTVFANLCRAVAGTSNMEVLVSPARWLFLLCFAAGGILFIAFVVSKRPQRRAACIVALLVASVIFFVQYPGLSRYYSTAKYVWYRDWVPGLGEAWFTLDKIGPKPINIAVSGTNLYHGFHGTGLQNRVNRFDYDFYNDDSKWIVDLQARPTHLLIVSSVHEDLLEVDYHDEDGFPIDVQVAERHPVVFDLFKDYGNVRLYVVHPPAP